EEIAQARQTNRAAIQDYIEREKRTRKHRLRIWTSIAATIVLATTLTLVYQTKRETLPAETVADILPGGNKAMLTLTDGRTIDLSSAQEGVIMGDDGIVYADGTRI